MSLLCQGLLFRALLHELAIFSDDWAIAQNRGKIANFASVKFLAIFKRQFSDIAELSLKNRQKIAKKSLNFLSILAQGRSGLFRFWRKRRSG